MSGAMIERIQMVRFTILATSLSLFAVVVAANLGWHSYGWLVTRWLVNDFSAAVLVHVAAVLLALDALINLGPKIGKFNADEC